MVMRTLRDVTVGRGYNVVLLSILLLLEIQLIILLSSMRKYSDASNLPIDILSSYNSLAS